MSTAPTVPYATLASVTSTSWSVELDSSTPSGASGSGLGQIVQSLDDVHQCLKIIFATVPGEDPWRPTFGCDLTKYLDKPLPVAIPAIVAEVSQAIETWEPRVILNKVTASYVTESPGQLLVNIVWQPNAGVVATAVGVIGSQTYTTQITVGGL